MVVAGLTVIELVLDATKVPPHEPLYQYQPAPVPNEPPETLSVVLPPAQIVLVPVIEVAAVEFD